MKAAILRAGSLPVTLSALPGSPKVSLSRQSSIGAVFSGERSGFSLGFPIVSLHFPMDKRKPKESRAQIRRALSETDIIKLETRVPGGSRCFTAGIPEEEYVSDYEIDGGFRTEFGISMEGIGFSGDGFGTGGKIGGDNGDDSYGDKRKMGDYYREMLKLNPGDPLLLRNYGRFLHEVEKDMERAEEYYGRAILASPGDGEVLSLYGNLIWERHRDESRAKSYFDRAVTASPDDCMVLGSYANFLWDAEEDDEEEEVEMSMTTSSASANPNLLGNEPVSSGRKSSPGSPLASSPRVIETFEQPVTLDVYSPDRLAGELFFLDTSLSFTIEELSRAPAEVLGRGSHGTLYKATLRNGHMLTVKWLRVGLVKHKKEFAKEVKKIGSVRHSNFVPVRAYYWGPREQERLLLSDYIHCDSLALHLYETTPRRYHPLSFSQRLKVSVEVAKCLLHLHDRGLPHGNLKPTNILLADPDYHACLTDYCLHRLMTPTGIAEQILNLGALGYRAPELASTSKPVPSFKADVYALGVILMELLTRRSAGDIISGQSGAVDLTDWVRLCDQEGRGMDCIDRDIASGEEHTKAMDDMLAISLRCILPVNERPNIRQVYEDLCSISL